MRPSWAAIARQLPFVLVMVVVAVALVLLAADRWRRAAFLLGFAAGGAAVLRAVIPPDRIGLLAVRGRVFDTVVLGITAGVALWLATSIDPLGTD